MQYESRGVVVAAEMVLHQWGIFYVSGHETLMIFANG